MSILQHRNQILAKTLVFVHVEVLKVFHTCATSIDLISRNLKRSCVESGVRVLFQMTADEESHILSKYLRDFKTFRTKFETKSSSSSIESKCFGFPFQIFKVLGNFIWKIFLFHVVEFQKS